MDNSKKTKNNKDWNVPTVEYMTAREATDIMRLAGLRMSPETLRYGIMSGQFPFGTCIVDPNDGKILNCTIYTEDLMSWLRSKGNAERWMLNREENF